MSQTHNNLDVLISLETYRNAGRSHIFPSLSSLQWFIRKNKPFLISNSALLMPAGRVFINEVRFDHAVMEIGKIHIENSKRH
jgi:hypothetical protein